MQLRATPITYLDIHHTADRSVNTEAVRRLHMDKFGWGDIGYQSVIEMDGTVGAGRDVKWAGAHDPGVASGESYNMNHTAYAIACIGHFHEPHFDVMPEVQFNALVKHAYDKCLLYKVPIAKVRRHKDQYNTACPGSTFPWDSFIKELGTLLSPQTPVAPVAPPNTAPVVLNYSYQNNAKVINDDLYIRDVNGNRLEGRYVAKGDNITVLDVLHNKQLVLVEYPTPAGVRTGYVKNVASLIQYYFQGEWLNGSTPETVFDQEGRQIGALDPRERATPILRYAGMLHVVYNTDKGPNTKSGYVAWDGRFRKF